MQPDYKTNDPRGWCGDPKRGAAMGRPSAHGLSDWTGRIRIARARLNAGGYDSNGTYFGFGEPLFWVVSDNGTIDYMLRAADRREAKRKVSERYPRATFWR